ncbi:hypothetical protein ALO71_100631 [Pseudomonas amygdali pv. dendropanacis]|uniref:Uncharacterized protein n=3 Tax=Pseudomonas syringae group genomosp. 2 TaxID=251698 RepID=A0A0Q0D3X3_PSEA0|nr:Uncharacterized protein AC510_3765 [Pseudomonas amygdali pv. myricae]KPW17008.1 Uncharacterized protein ALO90_05302 [Pseudomonas amygdali pv. aesculi]KPW68970.1 hypothetical protein ALO78_100585 [Pseudomonas amygdali pv. ciccaronei]KPX06973.1 Uncharacterized protein ALO74_04763 [Pseudomonas syringae pv. cunninghamiae]KPX21720.1 hypothetical protein ALO71_100631 [Pseudomonas amygdali pv. dendropanacis]KPY30425.1 Uncharacterized protein ALO49_04102 [Pseudomonas savastanoi pv. retacarpa]KPZ17
MIKSFIMSLGWSGFLPTPSGGGQRCKHAGKANVMPLKIKTGGNKKCERCQPEQSRRIDGFPKELMTIGHHNVLLFSR